MLILRRPPPRGGDRYEDDRYAGGDRSWDNRGDRREYDAAHYPRTGADEEQEYGRSRGYTGVYDAPHHPRGSSDQPPPPPPRQGGVRFPAPGGYDRYDAAGYGGGMGSYDRYADDRPLFPPPPPPRLPPPPRGDSSSGQQQGAGGEEDTDLERLAFEAELERVAAELEKVTSNDVAALGLKRYHQMMLQLWVCSDLLTQIESRVLHLN
jgi:hypothetical protein